MQTAQIVDMTPRFVSSSNQPMLLESVKTTTKHPQNGSNIQ